MKQLLLVAGLVLSLMVSEKTVAQNSPDTTANPSTSARTITGQVLNDKAQPLPGASIKVKGAAISALADKDGKFVIKVPAGTVVLQVSSVGMQFQEVQAGEKSTVTVILISEDKQLDDVIVVGYGTQRKATLLGAVANMKAKDVEDIPAANLSTLLNGRMPGVRVGQASGRPGSSTAIQIRTPSSWNAEPPLFVIDGFIRDQAAFDVLDPSEVESISVLKDASAAVYGARGTGGVVLVQTKRGQSGKPKISYAGSYGFSDATMFTKMLSAYDHATLVNDGLRITNPDTYLEESDWFTDDELAYFKTIDNNWLNDAWKSSYTTRHAINVSGGGNQVRYFGSATYYNENGNLPGTDYKKYTLRLGIDADITRDLKASVTLSGDNQNEVRPYNRNDANPDPLDGSFKALLLTPRWIPPYINGYAVGQNGLVSQHPLEINNINSYARTEGQTMVLNAALEYRIPVIPGLSVKLAYNQSNANNYGKQVRVNYNLYNFVTAGGHNHILTDTVLGFTKINNNERIQESYDRGKNYQFNGSIAYNQTFGKHAINALVLYEQSESEGNNFLALREGVVVPNFEQQGGFSEALDGTSGGATAGARLSYVGRVNYNYAGKYLLEAAFRYDGSIKFMPESRWGFFPSVAVGWRISEEKFFQQVKSINNLKIRASAGLTGNDNIGTRQWELSYGITGGGFLGGTALTNALQPRNSAIIASGVTWEKSASYNAGIDLGLTNGLNVSVDAFLRNTFDILDSRNSTLPTSSGIDKMPAENYGKMKAWGYEAAINYGDNFLKDFGYNIGVNISWAKSKVLQKFQSEGVIGTWADEIGKMPDGEVGFIALGILRTQQQLDELLAKTPDYTINGQVPQLGMIYYQDVGGPDYSNEPDGIIDENDRRIIAPSVAALNFGINLGLSWKTFRINANFGLGGFNTQVFYDEEGIVPPTAKLNGPAYWADHWTAATPGAKYPAPVEDFGYNYERSTFWMLNGIGMNLNNINASYDLPASLTKKWGIPQLRIYFAGSNIWTIVNPYKYKDPAIARFNSYPTLRSYNFGVNISL